MEFVAPAVPRLDVVRIVHAGKRRGGAARQVRNLVIHPQVPRPALGGERANHFARAPGQPVRLGILHRDGAFAAQPAALVLHVRILLCREGAVFAQTYRRLIAEIRGRAGRRHMKPPDIAGVPAALLQLARPADGGIQLRRGHEIVVPLRADGIRAAAAQKRLARGRAHRQRRVRVLKHDAFPREGVEVRGFYAPKPSIAHAVMPKLVGIDQQDIHIVRCG